MTATPEQAREAVVKFAHGLTQFTVPESVLKVLTLHVDMSSISPLEYGERTFFRDRHLALSVQSITDGAMIP